MSSAATTDTIWGAETLSQAVNCEIEISVLSFSCPMASHKHSLLLSHHISADTRLSSQLWGVDLSFSVSFSSFFQHDSRHHRYAQLVYITFPRTINCMRSWILWNLIFLISKISTRLWAFGPGEKNEAARSVRGRECELGRELGMIIRFKQVIWTTMVLIKLLFINCWYRHWGTKLS